MTSFIDIYNQVLVVVEDYRINNLYTADYNSFLTYMRGLLTVGIPEFTGCLQSLDYTTQTETDTNGNQTTAYYFINDLTVKEQSILAKIVVAKWWDEHIQNVVVYQSKIPNQNFKQMEISEGLKQKSVYKDKLYENIAYDINNYQLDNMSQLPFFGG